MMIQKFFCEELFLLSFAMVHSTFLLCTVHVSMCMTGIGTSDRMYVQLYYDTRIFELAYNFLRTSYTSHNRRRCITQWSSIDKMRKWTELNIDPDLLFQVKITSHNEEMLRAAVEQFIDKDYTDIEAIATETLEGHQRAMMGNMTVDQIFKDRKKFSSQVFDIASTDLFNMGIQVISYTLKDIKDEDQYMVSLGMARTAEIVRDARIGEAEANRDAQIEVAYSEEQRLASKLVNKTEVERAKRDYEVKKAAYDTEVETARAEAELAYKLQEAKVRQRIKEEMMTTEIIERMKLIGKFTLEAIEAKDSFWTYLQRCLNKKYQGNKWNSILRSRNQLRPKNTN